MKTNRRLRVRVRFLIFFPELAPTRGITRSKLYLRGKNTRRKCQMNTLTISRISASKLISGVSTSATDDDLY